LRSFLAELVADDSSVSHWTGDFTSWFNWTLVQLLKCTRDSPCCLIRTGKEASSKLWWCNEMKLQPQALIRFYQNGYCSRDWTSFRWGFRENKWYIQYSL
jgi:hypothetical protein